MQTRLFFQNEDEKKRAKKMGIEDLNKKYNLNEIVKGKSLFCATGITSGDLVKGVKIINNKFVTETLVTLKNSSIDVIKREVSTT